MKINQKEYKTLLVELDCLLDTRFTTLWLQDPSLAEQALKDEYHKRLKDLFRGVEVEDFNNWYSKRDKRTLAQSLPTPMKFLVLDFCKKTIEQMLATPFNFKPRVEINIHPYNLTETEQELIRQTFITSTKDMVDVKIVSYDYEYLNPLFVKENYELMIMYHYGKWLDAQSVNKLWEKYTCPNVTLMAPMLYMDHKVNIQKDKLESFDKAMDFLKPFVELSLVPVEMFSFIKPEIQKEPAKNEAA